MWHVGFRYHGDMNINFPMPLGQGSMGRGKYRSPFMCGRVLYRRGEEAAPERL